jgi:hypothetical protein
LDRQQNLPYLYIRPFHYSSLDPLFSKSPLSSLTTANLTQPTDFNRDFTASVGSRSDATDSRKNCQINLKLTYEPGFSFSVYSADYAGWADLDGGVTGIVKSTYYFSGKTDQVRSNPYISRHCAWFANACSQASAALSLNGPFHGKYFKQDDVNLAVWSPCGPGEALFNVNSEVALTPFATEKNGVLAATREGGRLTNNLYFAWRKC